MTESRVETLIAKLEKGRQKTHQILSELTADQWHRIVYTEPYPWTARHMLAHFLSAEEELLRMAQGVALGEISAPEEFDIEAFNTQEQKRLAGRSPQDLLDALFVARQATIDWVRTLNENEEVLDRVGRHPVLGQITLEEMITAIYGHQLLHMRDLKRS
jgi:hypothetical protein